MYQHVQSSPMHLLLYLVSAVMLVAAWEVRHEVAVSCLLAFVAVLMFILAQSFQTLTVSDRGDYLDVRYGPINLFGTRIAYDQMTAVEQGRTSVIDGWGIHFIPFRGWTFNLWGFECAKICLGKKVIRIGTDDSDNLVSFLLQRLEKDTISSS